MKMRTIVIGEAEVIQAGHEDFQCDAHFHAGERGADAEMRTIAKGDLTRIRAVLDEFFRIIGEFFRVAIG